MAKKSAHEQKILTKIDQFDKNKYQISTNDKSIFNIMKEKKVEAYAYVKMPVESTSTPGLVTGNYYDLTLFIVDLNIADEISKTHGVPIAKITKKKNEAKGVIK